MQLVVKIAKKHSVKSVIKSKSMVTEEMALNKALEAADVKVRETDLGEYILQINDNERPSHIIAPVVHKDKEQVADLFEKHHIGGRSHRVNYQNHDRCGHARSGT